MESVTGHFQCIDTHEEVEFHDQHGAFGFTSSSGDAYSCYQNTNTIHEAYREQLNNTNTLGGRAMAPHIFSLESYHGSSSHKSKMNPFAVETPVTCSTGDSRDLCNSFQNTFFTSRNSSFDLTEQQNAAAVQAQVQVTPNTKFLSISHHPENSGVTYLKTVNCSGNIFNMPMMEHGLSSGMRNHLVLTNSNLPFHCMNILHKFCADSPSSSKFALHDSIPKARSSNVVKACIYGAEKLPLPLGALYGSKPSGLFSSFASEHLNDFVTDPSDLTPENPLLCHPKDALVASHCHQQSEHVIDDVTTQMNENLLGARSIPAGPTGYNLINGSSGKQVESSISAAVNSLVLENDKEQSSLSPVQPLSDNDLFDGMQLDMRPKDFVHELWDDNTGHNSCSNMSADSDCISVTEMGLRPRGDKGLFSEYSLQQLLDAIVGDHLNKASSHGSAAKYVNAISGPNLENQFSTSLVGPSVYSNLVPSLGVPTINGTSGVLLPYCNSEIGHGSPKQELSNTTICSWIDDSCSMNTENSVLNQPKKPEEAAKVVKKRARPGESTRPRPKDRQQIQDRLKELREIVPNGAKCSIDALLDKTIKHMLFLQSVTKYADKLKQADEPKIIGEESGVVLKDNSGGVGGGGATWAYEVAGQTMVCPIIVEDLTPPGQMLVEMVCEDRGLFLEIADIIRGFGLIILKGIMEIRERKIWARFLVEANREVTRMDIFLSLIQLLQQNSCLRSGDLANKVMDKGAPVFPGYHQSPIVSSS
ncbi:unnamed protein product [Musa acuminata var. zebrina]